MRKTLMSTGSLAAMAALVLLSACVGPTTTRTGAVHDIRIAEGPEPADLIVNPGDEVRWVNTRTLPLRVELVNVKLSELSCERQFSNIFGVTREAATVDPNETASACFTQAGVVNYNLRMDSALPGGKVIIPGVIRIGNKP